MHYGRMYLTTAPHWWIIIKGFFFFRFSLSRNEAGLVHSLRTLPYSTWTDGRATQIQCRVSLDALAMLIIFSHNYMCRTIAWWMLDLWFGLDASGFDRASKLPYWTASSRN
jgi:hypothetical protein